MTTSQSIDFFMQGRLVVATHNKGKVKEFGALLAPYWQSFVSAAELNLPEPEETGQTFADNALLKARAAAGAGYWTLADDSGLCVNALGGDPGLYSARWAGPQKDFQMAMRRVHDGLANTNDRSAYFICVLALIDPDGREHVFEGRCEGAMTWPPRGSLGFGYDPCFVPQGDMRTFGEMPEVEKHTISHRAQAVALLADYMRKVSEVL